MENKIKNLTDKTLAILMAAAVMIMMSVPLMSLPVFAEWNGQAVITKTLTFANGVNNPNITFNFDITKHSFNGDTTKASSCPDLNSGNAKVATGTENTDEDATAAGIQQKNNSGDLLAGVTFPEAGQYTYTIKERQNTYTEKDGTGAGHLKDHVVYSQAEYLMSVIVGDNSVVKSVYVKKMKNDDGTDAADEKTVVNDNGEGMNFNNNYELMQGNDPDPGNPDDPDNPDNPDGNSLGLLVNKTVTGDGADQSLEFPFSITVTAPAGSSAASTAQIAANIISGTTKTPVTIGYGTAKTFNLKHGDKLVFSNVLIGSNVKIEETNSKGYTASVSGSVTSLDTLKNTGITLQQSNAGAGQNKALFQNAQQTFTGVLIKNLPYALLVLLALAGIIFYTRNRVKAREA